ncbi:MAG: aminodeoxychorismate/anthranilate synthase component II [Bacteroidia bacterium]|nr:aminodeoxychorismate/anthranilate synthase component II [Bacteroidia bacterium]
MKHPILLFDNYDSFTYNLKDYFGQLGEEVIVVRNDAMSLDELIEIPFSKLVISPGPKTPSDAGMLMEVIDHYHNKLPILGVCLGHQALGQYFGCKLEKAIRPMHGKVSEIEHNGQGLYQNLPSPLKVCRYHSLILKDFEEAPIIPTAFTSEGELMSFHHKTLPITGIQYHPEAILTDQGLGILFNWLENL